MKINKVVIALFSFILSSSMFAGGMGVEQDSDSCWEVAGACWGTPGHEPYRWSRVISLSAGPTWGNSGTKQQPIVPGVNQIRFSEPTTNSMLASGTLFLGAQRQLSPTIFGQLGLAIAGGTNANLNGYIAENVGSSENIFTYNYKVAHGHIAMKGELQADVNHMLRPYVNGSVGIGVNQAHDFKSTASMPIKFESNNTNAFACTLGAGLKRELGEHMQAGIGYEFSNWGKSELLPVSGQVFNKSLFLSSLYTNAVQFSLSYIG